MAIRPFPYDSLPRILRRDLNALAALRRLLGAGAAQALARWSQGCVRTPVRCGVPRLVDDARPAALRARGAELFELRGPQQRRGWLAVDGTLGAGLSAQLLGLSPAGPATVPLGLAERGLLCYALGWLVGELCTEGAWRVVAEPAPAVELAAEDVVGFECAVRLGTQQGFAWLSLSRGALLLAPSSRAGQRVGSPQRLRWLRSTPLSVAVELARLTLSRDELDALAPGDVIVSPSLPRGDERAVALRLGRGRLLARRGEPDSTCKEELVVTEGYRDDVEQHLDDGATTETDATLTDALPVELVVELGRMHMRGGQALDLQVGDVLTLARPLQGGVELRVGGQLVGRGELVDVEGEAGVRILEMND